MRPTQAEVRALDAIRYARMMMPSYATGGRIQYQDIKRVLEFSRVKVRRCNLSTPAYLTPPFAGWHRLFIANWLPRAAVEYIELHECGHCLAGDADEPILLQFSGPLPEAEEVADLFALSGIITAAEAEQGSEYVEQLMRERVPLEDRGWQKYRIPDLAPKVVRMRQLIQERL